MAHVFLLVEGRDVWVKAFKDSLSWREYPVFSNKGEQKVNPVLSQGHFFLTDKCFPPGVQLAYECKSPAFRGFKKDLGRRRLPYDHKKKKDHLKLAQPNIREMFLLDVSVPEQAIPWLVNDLCPLTSQKGSMKSKTKLIAAGLRLVFNLNPIEFDYENEDEEHQRCLPLKEKSLLIKFVNWLSRIKNPEQTPIVCENLRTTWRVRKKWLNIVLVGWKPDKWNEQKGELI